MCTRDLRQRERTGDVAGRKPEFVRLPGLYRRWEVELVLEAGKDLLVEEAGHADDGSPLFFAFQRERVAPDEE